MSTMLQHEVPKAAQPLLERFLAELETVYPPAKGQTDISVERDGTIWVSYPWPDDDDLHMAVSEHMAKIITDILVETDQHIRLVPARELSPDSDETIRPQTPDNSAVVG